ncbi:uncharacterized protein DUF4407 [Actinoplanes teichomyceticus]|uniref:Uncharacterized protein DUF4407 n=1 Tax=Actinoplanes teichomyceticus TaxID=1867 RepID=A0A561WKR4_ACTTI|nr:uncharacterized protein DUF4407 [Actinoplanes teichomyceticus]
MGRLLRMATGVNEDILAAMPAERTRFTAMGGVVLGTALIAMASMGVAIGFVAGGFPPPAVPFVLVWGIFVLSIDRWLMSVAASSERGRRALKLLPRLILAVAVGVVVAEPLVLVIFRSEIAEQSRREHADELRDLEGSLLACNPVPGSEAAKNSPAAAPRCAGFRLSLAGSAAEGRLAQIPQLQAQVTALGRTVEADARAHAELEGLARRECNGTSGEGLSGRFGVGPSCRRLRAQADRYRADHRIEENTAALANLRAEIDGITGRIGTDGAAFAEARQRTIEQRMAQTRDRWREPGLLDRMRLLSHLTDRNGYALAGEWALRLFLVLIDALPVMVKFLTGFTAYDEVMADRLEQEKAGALERNRAGGDRQRFGARLWRFRLQLQAQREHRQLEGQHLKRLRPVNEEIWQQVDEQADRLMREAPTVSFALPGRRRPRAEPFIESVTDPPAPTQRNPHNPHNVHDVPAAPGPDDADWMVEH